MKTLETPAGSLAVLTRAMDVRSIRHDLITGNLSNMDTPNYRSFDLSMKEALSNIDAVGGGMALEQSHPSHVQGNVTGADPMSLHRNPPRPYSLKGDGNTVDVDGEMVKLAENSLMYTTLAQMTAKEFQLFTTAVEGK
ncbi:flagellar basal body rod protein FlgB [Desulfococcus sp.]|uniref:flagellar basal body rod protein FlgB n=1 Tax=Desulfococcus sp. TaxID=2025834 RepID=UPI0035930661